MVTVKLSWQSNGQPASGKRVALGFDGVSRGVTQDQYTNSDGEARFDAQPGQGKVYVDGMTKYEGNLSGRVMVSI